MKLVDTHVHLDSFKYDNDRDEIIKKINEKMLFIVNISYDLESSIYSANLASKYGFIYAAVGFHPTDAIYYNSDSENKIIELIKNKKVIAIGEIGLDYYWMKASKDRQKEVFEKQMEIAKKHNLPVVIHTRDATSDTIEILSHYKEVHGILHCYPGSYEMVEKVLNNYYIGVGGVVTFKNAKKVKETVKKVPIDRIVVETDSPYLTPSPYRGKRNHPLYVKYIVEEIARIKNMPFIDVLNITNDNAKAAYKL